MASGGCILGIESSCDETAAAVVERRVDGGLRVRSSVVASQHDLHAEYGGVVPEIASRAHLERILPVIGRALAEARVAPRDVGSVAAGVRPGLIGSLLVGTSAAKGFAWALGLPFHAIDHVEAHLFSGLLDRDQPLEGLVPALGLVVSGGHTSLFAIGAPPDRPLEVELLGRSIDDAVGEALDKAAAMLGLPHPGGPNLERCAAGGDDSALAFPMPRLGNPLDFSLSGLKTRLLYAIRGVPSGRGRAASFPRSGAELGDERRGDLAASFQRAAFAQVVDRLGRAVEAQAAAGRAPRALLVGGGVVANRTLRALLEEWSRARGMVLVLPNREFCGDNAAMIAGTAVLRRAAGADGDSGDGGDWGDDLSVPAEPTSFLARGSPQKRRVAKP